MSESEKQKQDSKKLFRLNVAQMWAIILSTAFGVGVVLMGWANGLADLPKDIKLLQDQQKPLATLPVRVEALETGQKLLWQKSATDHDLLIQVLTTVEDIKRQQTEMHNDMRDQKK